MATKLTLTIEADSAEALNDAIRARAASVATPAHTLEDWSTDKLLAELRERAAKDGNVVRVVPFEDTTTITRPETPVTEKIKRTRKPQTAEKPAAPDDGKLPVQGEEAQREAPKTIAADSPAAATLDDVKTALNDFAGTKGQAAAREIMQTIGGAYRLADIAEDKWPALVKALTNEAQAKAA